LHFKGEGFFRIVTRVCLDSDITEKRMNSAFPDGIDLPTRHCKIRHKEAQKPQK